MGQKQSSKFCKHCGEQVMVVRQGPNHVLHLILTLITGVWVFVWLWLAIFSGPWRCTKCGLKP